ncbi:MAG: ATP-binding cassette domain-containing protein [Bacteroidales bacterium]|nr:ATP-binding cassette domain-containing protein [Bacteroidales bacterium]MBN2758789.1 ATP-binding cassette domain-containing protein [Bacteroidales bacterium]
MSEEILKALMQLFAIIVKQDEGVAYNEVAYVENFLTSQLNTDAVQEYLALFKSKVGQDKDENDDGITSKKRLTTVGESVKVLGICKKINKKLDQKQKVVVLVRLFELINSDRRFSDQIMAIINTVADVFNISKKEFKSIENFVIQNELSELDDESILLINDKENYCTYCNHIVSEALDGNIIILRVISTELYFFRYNGKQDVFLNGMGVYNNRIYLFAPGSTVKLPKGRPVYYSDVVANFLEDVSLTKLSFNVKNVSYRFPTGNLGLQNISFSTSHGKLVGIMGASGAGKTTLLNLLSGITEPSEGGVYINGVNYHKDREKLEGVIGYIPQDDLLIEELTVFQNLYYNAKLCFRDKTEDEIIKLVDDTLLNLGLFERKGLKVGTPMNKMISGGQRKRLNIALELIREPSILFVDEPTSGLSSRDSENVMELLSELTLKGKLIFVVIHQPSSDIYKMFDNMVILDQGGRMVYYGNPVEAIVYFKRIDNQINSELGECAVCGNVTPELIFNIVEAQVVDEFGEYTNIRKVEPEKWIEHFEANIKPPVFEDVEEDPPKILNIPRWIKQFRIFTVRDVLSKISNTQYVVLNLLEAPLLGLILSFIIYYIADPGSSVYIFYENENIPPYIFMSIVVALFLGLTVSAEEIFRDRMILKREKFLNLSRSAYLVSKISILTVISAIQSILFVVVGNTILHFGGMYFEYWIILFSTFVFANMMGLVISSTFNSAVTIYILIPLLMIPQMSLGGAMFSFDKLNRVLGTVGRVPLIAEFMVSRWAYESLMVNQFVNNKFEKIYYDLDKQKSTANFKQVYYLPELEEYVNENLDLLDEEKSDSIIKIMQSNFDLLINEMTKESKRVPSLAFEDFELLTLKNFDDDAAQEIIEQIDKWSRYYGKVYNKADKRKQKTILYFDDKEAGSNRQKRHDYHNEKLHDIVINTYEKNKIWRYKNSLIQQYEPIFWTPDNFDLIGFRAHFYAPKKVLFGKYFDTFWFDLVIIWIMSILLYIPLYYDHLKKIINFFSSIDFSKFKIKRNKKEDKIKIGTLIS